MATDATQAAALDNFSDATFRNWVLAFRTALTNVGLLKLSGAEAAGQIDLATVTRPTTGDSMRGFDVFRFSDALQATAPVFIRIDYGSSQGDAGGRCGGVQAKVGAGVNAATGALTGVVSDTFFLGQSAIDGTGHPIWASGGTNRINVAAFLGSNASQMALNIERTKDGAGADTNEGVIVQSMAPQTYLQGATYTAGLALSQVLRFTGVQADTAPRNIFDAAPVFPAGRANATFGPGKNGVFNADTAFYPWLVPSSRGHENPGLGFCGHWAVNLGDGAIPAVKMFGVNHNYRSINGNWGPFIGYFDDGAATAVLQKQTLMGLLMRWE